MKIYHFLLFGLCCLLFQSCDSDNKDIVEPDLKISDVEGVWEDSNNKYYFLSLDAGGGYSLCLDEQIIGAGRFSISNKTLALFDTYTNKTDYLSIDLKNSSLNISGEIYKFLSDNKQKINIKLTKSSKKPSPSKVGKTYRGTGDRMPDQYYRNVDTRVEFLNNNLAQYIWDGYKKSNGKHVIWNNISLYYVYLAPYTYTYVTDIYKADYHAVNLKHTEKKVVIYNFDKEFADINQCFVK